MKIIIVKNAQHSLMDTQLKLINDTFESSEISYFDIPAEGWDLDTIKSKATELKSMSDTIIFLTPLAPLMIDLCKSGVNFYQLFNSKREKKELPNGKIISVVAKDGWELIS